MPKRRSDVLEAIAERFLLWFIGGSLLIAISFLLWTYRGDEFYMLGFFLVFMGVGVAMVSLAIIAAFEVQHVTSFSVKCPYCETKNVLTAKPEKDFTCIHCQRVIPINDGQVMQVYQVRCGYCNELNYYNDKSEALICENCDHEIPIAVSDEQVKRNLPRGFTVQDDPNLYELLLISPGPRHEEVISTLQHMLAMSRAQVKQILTEVPVTLLHGIPRRKAEALQTQLTVHDAVAEFRPITQ